MGLRPYVPVIGKNKLTGEELYFESVKAAAAFLGVGQSQISVALQTKYCCHGYFWSKAPVEKEAPVTPAEPKSPKPAVVEYYKKFDFISIRLPIGQKALIKEHTEQCGEPINDFLVRAVNETMERDKNSMPKSLHDLSCSTQISSFMEATATKINEESGLPVGEGGEGECECS